MLALPYHQVPEALQRVRDSGAHPSTKGVFEMMVYTGARQGEVRGALCEEIDFDQATLTVPPDRTKSGRPFRIPLSKPVLAILRQAWERTGGVGWLFPAATGRPISNTTLRKLLKSLGVASLPHGFRSSMRTYMAEHGISDEVAELALGHTHKKVPSGIDLLGRG